MDVRKPELKLTVSNLIISWIFPFDSYDIILAERVSDFRTELDASQFVNAYGTIYSIPDSKGDLVTVDEIMQSYVQSTNKFKRIRLEKRPLWNFQQLDQAIRGAVKSTGFPHSISVTFPMKNNRMTVSSDSSINKFQEHGCTRFLCCISCLCIIFYPILLMARKTFGASTLRADFPMTISEQDWFMANYWNIIRAVRM